MVKEWGFLTVWEHHIDTTQKTEQTIISTVFQSPIKNRSFQDVSLEGTKRGLICQISSLDNQSQTLSPHLTTVSAIRTIWQTNCLL